MIWEGDRFPDDVSSLLETSSFLLNQEFPVLWSSTVASCGTMRSKNGRLEFRVNPSGGSFTEATTKRKMYKKIIQPESPPCQASV